MQPRASHHGCSSLLVGVGYLAAPSSPSSFSRRRLREHCKTVDISSQRPYLRPGPAPAQSSCRRPSGVPNRLHASVPPAQHSPSADPHVVGGRCTASLGFLPECPAVDWALHRALRVSRTAPRRGLTTAARRAPVVTALLPRRSGAHAETVRGLSLGWLAECGQLLVCLGTARRRGRAPLPPIRSRVLGAPPCPRVLAHRLSTPLPGGCDTDTACPAKHAVDAIGHVFRAAVLQCVIAGAWCRYYAGRAGKAAAHPRTRCGARRLPSTVSSAFLHVSNAFPQD